MKVSAKKISLLLSVFTAMVSTYSLGDTSIQATPNASPKAQDTERKNMKNLNLYRSDRVGGGDFGFEIQNKADHYLIQVNHQNFKKYGPAEKTLKIKKKSISNQDKPSGTIDVIRLMEGYCGWIFEKPPPDCPDCLTGTWKSEYIQFLASTKVQEIYGHTECETNVNFEKIEALALSIILNSKAKRELETQSY